MKKLTNGVTNMKTVCFVLLATLMASVCFSGTPPLPPKVDSAKVADTAKIVRSSFVDSMRFRTVTFKDTLTNQHIVGLINVRSGNDGLNINVDSTSLVAIAEGITFGLSSYSGTYGVGAPWWYFYGPNPTNALDSFSFKMLKDTLFGAPVRKGFIKDFGAAEIDTLHGKADSSKMADSAKTVRAGVVTFANIAQGGASTGNSIVWSGSAWTAANVEADLPLNPTFYGDAQVFGNFRIQNQSTQWDLNKAVALPADTFLTIHVGDTIKDICTGEDTTDAIYSQYSWVHLGGVYIPGGWNGYNRWMVGTPYTCGPASELPVMRVSNDGVTWAAFPGAAKLVAYKNESDTVHGDTANYLSDAELIVGADGKLWVYWRSTDYIDSAYTDGWSYTVGHSIWCKSSTDGSTWSTALRAIDWDTNTTTNALYSPAVWLDSSSTYRMLTVTNSTQATNYILLWGSVAPDTGWALIDTVRVEGGSTLLTGSTAGVFDSTTGCYFWHLEIVPTSSDEAIILATVNNKQVDATGAWQTLIGRTRDNGRHAYFRPDPIFVEDHNIDTIRTTSQWDAGGQYRGTAWVADRGYGKELEYIYVGYNAKNGGNPGFKPGRTFIRFDKEYESRDMLRVAGRQRWNRTDSVFLSLDVTDTITQDTTYLFENYTTQGSDADTFSVSYFCPDTFCIESVFVQYVTSNGTTTNVKIDSLAFKRNGAQGDQWGTMVSNVWCGSGTDRASATLSRLALPWRFKMALPEDQLTVKFFTNLAQDDSWIRVRRVSLFGYKP